MERAKKSRQVIRTAFTKMEKQVEELLKDCINVDDLTAKWRILAETQERLKLLDQEIYDLMLDANVSEADLEAEVEGATNYLYKFRMVEVKYENVNQERVSQASGPTEYSHVTNNGGTRKFKLPIIEFKKFSGDIREWLPFWSQFQKINDDTNIADEDKFQYLIQATIPNTRARELVESFPPTRENYTKVIASLKSRFGRDDLLIEVHVRDMLKLVLQNTVSTERVSLSSLYDKIETQLRVLESLGVTTDTCAAMLIPLVESCLPESLLRVWQRSPKFYEDNMTTRDRLTNLMQFLKNEVESAQRIALAVEGFGISSVDRKTKIGKSKIVDARTPTAAGLINTNVNKCIFCNGTHQSEDCFKARKMSFTEKNEQIIAGKACFLCLQHGHQSKNCRERLRCVLCGGRHVVIMCKNLPSNKRGKTEDTKEKKASNATEAETGNDKVLANHTETSVFLQTLRVRLLNNEQEMEVRAILDTGSQKSYISADIAEELGYECKGKESLVHTLFGGVSSSPQDHNKYEVRVSSLDGKYTCRFEVLDQPEICSHIPTIPNGVWSQELLNMNIELTDIHHKSEPIQLLMGADVVGKLFTGRKQSLHCGVVALQTHLGWTLMGKVSGTKANRNVTMTSLSLLVKDASIEELWKLETIGIMHPGERKNKEELNAEVREHFLQTVDKEDDGRYVVHLPWLKGHPPLPTNLGAAEKRLRNVVAKLRTENLLENYQNVLEEWKREGVIEKIPDDEVNKPGHYLPHRAVIKENSETTKIRPVFDASAHEKNCPSLNDCLAKGENLIELIPSILLRFRFLRYGIVSDIRKAFLQISVIPKDRDYLRFLWQEHDGTIVHLRHKRVVFGVCCSPFLLGATIQYHLKKILEKFESDKRTYSKDTVLKLIDSFYVDNCITSVPDEKDLFQFQVEANQIMEEGFFELRGWEMTSHQPEEANDLSPLLGMRWNRYRDTLLISKESVKHTLIEKLTKREILSITQKIFDPMGYMCPTTLIPKLLLQRMWNMKLNWDDEVTEDIRSEFWKWYNEINHLTEINIDRWIGCYPDKEEQWSIHTFVDASQNAYAAAVFIRVETDSSVHVSLLQAKSRVSPVKKLSIPRLELMGATIGARLYNSIMEALKLENIPSYFWSDSSTVVSWIQREDRWATFVWNRVEEIRSLTSRTEWHHVAGTLNPADLPSRGCSPRQLLLSRWWEGPPWLREPSVKWPNTFMTADEDEINAERKKTVVSAVVTTRTPWYCLRFSSYRRTVATMAWVCRFVTNCRFPKKRNSEALTLTAEELEVAEKRIIYVIQTRYFDGVEDKRIASLNPIKDEEGILRVRTPIVNRDDAPYFRLPVLLPAKDPIVEQLIREQHIENCHCGVQGLMSILREKYWILGGRKSIRTVINKCISCLRQKSRNFEAVTPPLPKDRVRDAIPFEISGVDLAGPLYLKEGQKAWIVLFTCAVYRAVHLEVVTSLSTNNFLQAFRRFVARRGRPKIMYSDNGTNFVGAENAFSRLNWTTIKSYSSAQRISWKFNPLTAAWWGGWWERLIQLVKQLLKRVLGKACLLYEELLTLLCDCEAIVNARPLTYLSNDPSDLVALTPNMFLHDQAEFGLPDCDAVDASNLIRRVRYIQKLRNDLRSRFRIEYLGQLKQVNKRKVSREIKLNEIVLVGSDSNKRIDWPLGRVDELIRGKDNKVRLVRVKTANGMLLRTIQRLYPLECRDSQEVISPAEPADPDISEDEVSREKTRSVTSDSASGSVGQSGSDVNVQTGRLLRSGRVC